MKPLLIKGGRVVDPSQDVDRVADLLLQGGLVRGVHGHIDPPEDARVIDAAGKVVCSGFVDLHCHLREPGFEDKETIATGTRAAARGGFTTVCAMPNTNPAIDSPAVVEFVLRKASDEGSVRVLTIGCVTKGSNGRELAQMGELAKAGVVGFSDDGNPVADAYIMRQALSYSSSQGLPVINHCEVPELFHGGSMHEGWISNRLGVKGIPASAEEIMASRDIALAELTGGRLHLAHVSAAGTVDLVRGAKAKGLPVTCEVTPHHLTLSDEAVMGNRNEGSAFDALDLGAYDTQAKVNPPLRGRADVAALVEGLRDGAIDVVATDHAPHNRVHKLCTMDEAAFGISVLETALGSLMSLVHSDAIELSWLIDRMTAAPARFLGRSDLGSLRLGTQADVTIFDPDADWTVDAENFASRGKNTPLDGVTLRGQVVATIVGGEVVYQAAT